MNIEITAKDFIKEYLYVTKDDIEDVHDSLGAVENILIEFAKIHVKSALKSAAKNYMDNETNMSDCPDYLENGIFNAYPENLIQ